MHTHRRSTALCAQLFLTVVNAETAALAGRAVSNVTSVWTNAVSTTANAVVAPPAVRANRRRLATVAAMVAFSTVGARTPPLDCHTHAGQKCTPRGARPEQHPLVPLKLHRPSIVPICCSTSSKVVLMSTTHRLKLATPCGAARTRSTVGVPPRGRKCHAHRKVCMYAETSRDGRCGTQNTPCNPGDTSHERSSPRRRTADTNTARVHDDKSRYPHKARSTVSSGRVDRRRCRRSRGNRVLRGRADNKASSASSADTLGIANDYGCVGRLVCPRRRRRRSCVRRAGRTRRRRSASTGSAASRERRTGQGSNLGSTPLRRCAGRAFAPLASSRCSQETRR